MPHERRPQPAGSTGQRAGHAVARPHRRGGLAVIAAVTFCDVVGRYFFNAPFAFTVELTQMAMALVVYFGVGLVTHEDAHISADVVTLRLPPRCARCWRW